MALNLLSSMNKVLICVELSKCSDRAIEFAGCLLGRISPEIVKEVCVIHVLSAGHLEASAERIDFRVDILKDTALFQRLRETYLQEKIYPVLDNAVQKLHDLGVKAKLSKEIIEGDPAKEIIAFAKENGFQTVIMGRRGRSCLKEKFLGSCSLTVSHRPGIHTTYIVGQKVKDHPCPVPKILVPIDGSETSLVAVKEAAELALALKTNIENIILLHVVDTAYEVDRLLEKVEKAKEILERTKKQVISYGISQEIIKTEIRIGRPANEIIAYATEEKCDIIMMGRRGLSGIKEFILGSVSMKVLHKAEEFTIALVSER